MILFSLQQSETLLIVTILVMAGVFYAGLYTFGRRRRSSRSQRMVRLRARVEELTSKDEA